MTHNVRPTITYNTIWDPNLDDHAWRSAGKDPQCFGVRRRAKFYDQREIWAQSSVICVLENFQWNQTPLTRSVFWKTLNGTEHRRGEEEALIGITGNIRQRICAMCCCHSFQCRSWICDMRLNVSLQECVRSDIVRWQLITILSLSPVQRETW